MAHFSEWESRSITEGRSASIASEWIPSKGYIPCRRVVIVFQPSPRQDTCFQRQKFAWGQEE
jgi:hypothetical protein